MDFLIGYAILSLLVLVFSYVKDYEDMKAIWNENLPRHSRTTIVFCMAVGAIMYLLIWPFLFAIIFYGRLVGIRKKNEKEPMELDL